MKQKKIRFSFKPLQASISIVPVGSVSARQTYSFDFLEYTPDYELTPLVLQPHCVVFDRDGVIPGNINASLTNMKWMEGEDKPGAIIDASNLNYEITDSGTDKGRIKIKRNIPVLTPLTLFFYAEYVDPRNGQILVFQDSHQVVCVNESPAIPGMKLDVPTAVFYDPFNDTPKQTIKATLMIEDDVMTDTSRRRFWWFKQLENTIRLFDPELDPELVSVNDDTIVIDREFMGEGVGIICKGEYANTEETLPNSASASALVETCTICRRVPDFDFDYSGVPGQIAPGQSIIYPKLIVTTNKKVIKNPLSVLRATWFTKKETAGATWQQVAHGEKPSISTTAITDSTGKSMDLGLEVEDRGPLCILTDKDGNELTDQDGNILWGN
ncbi:MAG: hypothetical protein LUG98_01560 [Tannerellaceae bacterium]|nr:hypothetical protein [Tannerellaceae bacterium]